jgi:hypothetical protein
MQKNLLQLSTKYVYLAGTKKKYISIKAKEHKKINAITKRLFFESTRLLNQRYRGCNSAGAGLSPIRICHQKTI